MVLYLSGPLGTDADENRFNAAESYLHVWKGHTVLRPVCIPDDLGTQEFELIEDAMIEASDAIVMLRGWGKSDTARASLMRSLVHDKKVFYGIEAVPFAGEDEQDG